MEVGARNGHLGALKNYSLTPLLRLRSFAVCVALLTLPTIAAFESSPRSSVFRPWTALTQLAATPISDVESLKQMLPGKDIVDSVQTSVDVNAAAYAAKVDAIGASVKDNFEASGTRQSVGKVPSLWQFVTETDPSVLRERFPTDQKWGAAEWVPILQGKLATWETTQTGQQFSESLANFGDSLTALRAVFLQQAWSAAEIEKALNLKDTTVWYGGLAVLTLVLAAKGTTVSETPKAPVDVTTPSVPSKSKAEKEQEEQDALTAAQLKELKDKTSSVNEELVGLKTERAQADYALATMKSDFLVLKNELSVRNEVENELRAALQQTQQELAQEMKQLRADLDSRVKSEKTLQTKLTKTEKSLEEERGKVASMEDENESLQEKVGELGDEIAVLRAQLLEMEENPKAATKGPEKTKEKAKEKAEPEPIVAAAVAKEEMYFANTTDPFTGDQIPVANAVAVNGIAETATNEKTAKKAATLKKVKKVTSKQTKVGPAKQKTPSAVAGNDDWSSLSASTLKRKTIKDLTAYLESRGAPTTGPDGKILKKAELVETVLAQ